MQNSTHCRWLALLLALTSLQLGAQTGTAVAADAPVIPADDFDRGTPFQSAEGFLLATDTGNYEIAAEYLDLRNLRGEARDLSGARLARRFDVIIKRATWVDVDELTDHPEGRSNDNLPDYRDSIGIILDEQGKKVRLLMQKVPRGDGVSIWKISNSTVALVPQLYKTYGYPEFVENLRRSLPQMTLLGIELFKVVIILTVGLLAYAAVFLVALGVKAIRGDPDSTINRRIFRFLRLPAGLWSGILSMNLVASSLGRGVTTETLQRISPIPVLLTLWVLCSGMNLLRDIYSIHLDQRGRPGATVLLHPAGNALKLLISVGAALIYLDQLGINITTLLAGLGVGGIAIALALQKPMEDVFGAITLYTQQPIRVGDFCRVGQATGTIEEIGLRTTRIRTLANTLIALPNSRLANEAIDNISAREKILYRPTLRLKYDTTPEQLQSILGNIRNLLSDHDNVLQKHHRARFKEFADDALLIEVYAYIATTDWTEYLAIAEALNIRILEIIAAAGTTLALPATTLHFEQNATPAAIDAEATL